MLRFAFFSLLLPLSIFAHRTTLRHIESGGIGYKDGYTTLELFLASDPCEWKVTPFLDARGHVFDNGKWAVNGGAGLRALWGNRVYGLNTYYDYRSTGRLHANQVGVGLETLGELFDFRINGYLPFGKKTSAPYDPVLGTFSGHYLLLSQKIETAMKGFNGEFGFHLGKSAHFDFYAAAGPYYFIGKESQATWGGKGRISATYKDILTLEISDSYDRTFQNKFQGQVGLTFSFGPKSKVKEQGRNCNFSPTLNDRMLQPVDRQEIIVIDTPRKNTPAINPATGLPYFFIFVDNTSSSNGTYESPYHSFAQAQSNSSPNDIIYVFPGDGTTRGMNAGIILKANQKLWGSGISHSIQTTDGTFTILAESTQSPTITNTDADTDGDAITLATNNAVSGLTIDSPLRDGIYGTSVQNLEISSCTFEHTGRFAIAPTFDGSVAVSITNSEFVNNTNGIFLTLNGTSTVICSDNTFQGQTSTSEAPLEITANSNSINVQIADNTFNENETGSVLVTLNSVINATLSITDNIITNNSTGSRGGGLGSNIVVGPAGTSGNCSILLQNNLFSDNASNAFFVDTTGTFTTFNITALSNTMTSNGGGGIYFGSNCTHFTLTATNNEMDSLNDNGISLGGGASFQTATITVNDNTISNIGNMQNGIAISRGSTTLNFTAENNIFDTIAGTGILCYASEFTNMTTRIADNQILFCQNLGSNAASGISLDTYTTLAATITNNSLAGNADPGFAVGVFTAGDPNVCMTLTGNTSNTGYSLTNPGSGVFHLSPCNAAAVNTGTITPSGVTSVQSCPGASPCP